MKALSILLINTKHSAEQTNKDWMPSIAYSFWRTQKQNNTGTEYWESRLPVAG